MIVMIIAVSHSLSVSSHIVSLGLLVHCGAVQGGNVALPTSIALEPVAQPLEDVALLGLAFPGSASFWPNFILCCFIVV